MALTATGWITLIILICITLTLLVCGIWFSRGGSPPINACLETLFGSCCKWMGRQWKKLRGLVFNIDDETKKLSIESTAAGVDLPPIFIQ